VASASGRSRSSRRVSPPGTAELLRARLPYAVTSKPWPSGLADDAAADDVGETALHRLICCSHAELSAS
jgi:hypothetical protein